MAGRLQPGVAPAQAQANLNAIASDLAREYPTINAGLAVSLARPGLLGDALGRPVRAFTFGVLVLAGLVLLVACTNLASMMLARGADRRREMAIRVSIGAGQARLVRQLVTETMLLAVCGGAAGYAAAAIAARALSDLRLPVDFPIQFDIRADGRVLLFAFLVSTIVGLLFAVAPARQAASTDPSAALKGGASAERLRRWAFRDVLVAAQVALCFVVVSACLLSLRGLQEAAAVPEKPVYAIAEQRDSREDGERFRQRVLESVQRVPGVRAAAYSNSLPLSIDQSTTTAFGEDAPPLRPAEMPRIHHYEVSPGFFQTLGMRIVSGRDFDWHDTKASRRIAIVNETFARLVLHSSNAVGKRFFYGWNRVAPVEIVGIVADGKYQSLTESPRAAVFDPILQAYNTSTTLVLRSARPEEEMVAEMRRAIAALDPGMPVYGAGSLDEMLGFVLFPSRAAAIALGAFGLLAVVLSATGVHGLVAYAVAQRRRELGIRIAIGAGRLDVLRLVLARMTTLLVVGCSVGICLALAASRILASIVYQASPRDPLLLAAVAGSMLGVGVVAGWSPARRSLRIDPVSALRAD